MSDEYEVTSGVPQGSHLGPLLFNILVNDITYNKQSEWLLYADDLKMFRVISNDSDILHLQRDIDQLSDWCINNKLDLNANKCAVVSYSRSHSNIPTNYILNGYHLQEVTDIKDLGIQVDNKLTFVKHVDKVIQQAFKVLGLIIRAGKDFSSPLSMVCLYRSLVRPILE